MTLPSSPEESHLYLGPQPQTELNGPETPPMPDIEFLYVDHGDQDAEVRVDEIWEVIKDKDIIALETITESQGDRKIREMHENLLTRPDSTSNDLKNWKNSDNDPFVIALITKLHRSGKKIVLVDVNGNEPSFEHKDNEFERWYALFDNRLFNYSNRDVLVKVARAYYIAVANFVHYRDQKVRQQIQALMSKTEPNLKIGAILGAVHTASSHGIANASRIFIDHGTSPARPLKQLYDYSNEAIRNVIFDREDKNTKEFIERAILEDYVINLLPDNYDTVKIRNIIAPLYDEEVSSILDQIHKLGSEGGDTKVKEYLQFMLVD